MAGTLIIGAGQAAASLAAKLRALGDTAPITILGDEPAAPYQRPPLSKAYLLGEMGLDRLELRAPDWWAENDIRLLTGTTALHIDRAAKTVETSAAALPYDRLALTTGATPRPLAGALTIRNLADVDALRPRLQPGQRLVVIGGGYIGLEAAAVARKLGLEVTLIEAAPRILGRVAATETADMIRALHQRHGVTLLENTAITGITPTAVTLTDRNIPADLVIAGIGVTPNTALAETAGLASDNGIATDEQGRTSDPAIWSAGDCASFPWRGTQLRLESVGNAIDMAELVAENMLGAGKPYVPKPWFWSDQFDAKLQIAGLNTGFDRTVTRPSDQGGSVWYFAKDRLLAVDALNDPRAYMVGKRLIDAGRSADPALIADAPDLKALL
ncbi:MAG: FAD/NAD(P)-binding oxidoreductase [Paracoccus sp. (in: a-proteobacteria)]|uniref:NAD(P)/FAD-dependent oxidoreductase n=1 Tax=Paracoccus sp. TaxID=267 RepID=UPI0026DFD641|nr:FAD/NAD(P)-binding oxidoreductase [Paracoccus sp. (in: a-proteobacteria)]MDO5620197.1 FAD/NAD(P)-binding oxidoreductase [Paracoccus sp. (in: a-proteobacteria)]